MNHYREQITMQTTRPTEIVEITGRIAEAVARSAIAEGLALVFPLHTSSAVYLSDSDLSLTLDFADLLDRLVPASVAYRHDRTDYKRNAAGHLRRFSRATASRFP